MESTAVSADGSPPPVPAFVPPDTTVSLEVLRLPVDELPGGVGAAAAELLTCRPPLEWSERPKAAFLILDGSFDLAWHSLDPPHSLLYISVPC